MRALTFDLRDFFCSACLDFDVDDGLGNRYEVNCNTEQQGLQGRGHDFLRTVVNMGADA